MSSRLLVLGCCVLLTVLCVSESAAQTNFGTVNLGTTSSSLAITVNLPSAATLGQISVRTLGAENLDYADTGGGTCTTGTAYAANTVCTVNVSFSPQLPGQRSGAVVLLDSSTNVIGYTALAGIGLGPRIYFPPGIETSIGSGITAPGNIAVDGKGNLFIGASPGIIVETWNGSAYMQSSITTAAGVGGIVVDGGGNIYFAGDDGVIHKETPSGTGYAETTFGNGMYHPNGMSMDASGNIYVADAYNGRVLKESPSAGTYIQTDILDCGTVGTQSCPASVASDAAGNLFIVSYTSNQILELIPNAGSYTQQYIDGGLVWPSDIVIDGLGNLYIADTLNNRVVKETPAAGSYTQSTVSSSGLYWPWGLAVDSQGNVYISDSYHNRVLKEDISDAPDLTFASTDVGATSSDSPQTVSIANNGNAALTFSAITFPANYSQDNSVPSPCLSNTSLALAQSCNLGIDFKPVSVPWEGSVPVTEDVSLSVNLAAALTPKIAVTGTAIGPATSSITLISTPSTGIVAGQSITLAAIVSAAGVPVATGSIAFTVGATSLGNGSLNSSGVATLVITNLPVGTDTVTASYAGDSQHSAATATLSIAVSAPPSPTYTIQLSSSSLTLSAGSSGSDAVTITPLNGFNQQVTFTCSGLPVDTACSFAPPSVTPAGNAAAGSVLTIRTNVTSTNLRLSRVRPSSASDLRTGRIALSITIFGFLSLLGIGNMRKARMWYARYLTHVAFFAGLFSLALLTSCGGSSSNKPPAQTGPLTPAGSSTVTVTATAGSNVQTATFMLTIQ